MIPGELLDDEGFRGKDGSKVEPGELGENITTRGVELGGLGVGTRLIFVDADGDGDEGRTGTDSPASSFENKEQSSSSSENGTTEADTKSRTDPPNPKPPVADTTEFFLLLTMGVSALFLLLRHVPHPLLGLLLLLLAVVDFLRSTSHPLSRSRPFPISPTPTHPPTIILTGLRNPCAKIDDFKPGLLAKSYLRDGDGKSIGARVGVMGVVERGGVVKAGMRIVVREPREWVAMERI